MKKLLICIMAVMLLTGCNQTQTEQAENVGGKGGGTVSVAVDSEVESKSKFNGEEVLNNLQTTAYTWKTKYGGYYLALVIKNNSTLDCSLSADVSLKDKDGNLIGAKDDTVEAFGSGEEICLVFNNDESFENYEYEYTVEELDYYEAVCKDLTCEPTLAKGKVIVSVTNNGTKNAEYVTARALFMSGDQVVGTNYSYVGDSDSEIKPGKKETEEISDMGAKGYDSVKVYLSGRVYSE